MIKSILTAVLAIGVSIFVNSARANDPTGTWKSVINFHNQQLENAFTLLLDTEGPTLSGGYSDALLNGEVPLTKTNYKNHRVTFSVVREFTGQKFIIKYTGTLQDDVITGKASIDYGDRSQTTDWVARRQR